MAIINRTKAEFLDRLFHYMIGLMLGCVMVGMLMYMRTKMVSPRPDAGPAAAESIPARVPD